MAITSDLEDNQDSVYEIVEGLAGPGTVSFRSVNHPDRYLRHSCFDLWLHLGSDSLFSEDASFLVRPALDGGEGVAFESYNYPNHYLRAHGNRIRIDQRDCCSNFDQDSSWLFVEVSKEDVVNEDDSYDVHLDSNLRVRVTKEVLTTQMLTNADEAVLLSLVQFDESRENSQIYQQLGGSHPADGEPVTMNIQLPYYNFDKGVLQFHDSQDVEVVFGDSTTESVSFSDVMQVELAPMGLYRVTVFVTKVIVDSTFSGYSPSGESITGTYSLVEYTNP